MMTSTFLDLGLVPAPNGLPGAPPAVAAGGGVPDFASALTGLITGTAPAALATGIPTVRQDLAVTGKMAPLPAGPKVRTIADAPVCELLPPATVPAAAVPDIVVTPDVLGDVADLAEPSLEPTLAWLLPPTKTSVSVRAGDATDHSNKGEATDTADPRPEQVASWVLPPVVVPVISSPVVATPASGPVSVTIAATAVPAIPVAPVVDAGPMPAAPPATTTDRASAPEPTPTIKFAPQPRVRPAIVDCELPAPTVDAAQMPMPGSEIAAPQPDLAPRAAPLHTVDALAPVVGAMSARLDASQVRVTHPAMPAGPAPIAARAGAQMTMPATPATPVDRVTASVSPVANAVVRPLADLPPAILVAQTPAVGPRTAPTPQPDILVADAASVPANGPAAIAQPVPSPREPGNPAVARDPIAGMAETRLREAVGKRLEIQPVALPARDSGATLAAAAAIRAAPAVAATISERVAATAPTITPLDASQLAPIAAGAPAAQPVGAAQQAGIDLTQDQGMHRMIDRIEHLRDALDTRETRIRLIPDALGAVDISVRRDAASDSVQVHFTAAEAGTRQLIADAQQRLVEIADARGVRIERATVEAGSNGATTGQSWTGGDGQSRQQQAQTAQQPRAPARAAREAESQSPDDRLA